MASPEVNWIDCHYGDTGHLQLWKHIDDKLQRCVVTAMKHAARGRKKIDIACE